MINHLDTLLVTISFWLLPNHYGQVQINLVRPKPLWTDQNCFGHIEGQGIREYKDKNNTTLRLGPPQKRYELQALKNNDCWLASVVHMT